MHTMREVDERARDVGDRDAPAGDMLGEDPDAPVYPDAGPAPDELHRKRHVDEAGLVETTPQSAAALSWLSTAAGPHASSAAIHLPCRLRSDGTA